MLGRSQDLGFLGMDSTICFTYVYVTTFLIKYTNQESINKSYSNKNKDQFPNPQGHKD